MSDKIDFGVFLSTEQPSFSHILSDVKHCEDLGYHSAWFSDHVLGMYGGPSSNRFENWTLLSALAGTTNRIRLGQLVLCNPFRHPPLLAKMTATLDAISGGRLELGLGAGWHEPEFVAYGYRFEKPWTRVGRLSEAVQIMKMMWTEPSPSFKGRYYRIEGAYCNPKPVQKPHPPILIGGSGEKNMLKVVARYADVCNFPAWQGRPEDYRHKLDVLERYCRRVKRDPSEIRRSWAAFVLISKDAKESEEKIREYVSSRATPRGPPPERLIPPVAGTPEECIKQIQRYVDIGVSFFILRFMGSNYSDEMTVFAEEVMPVFK